VVEASDSVQQLACFMSFADNERLHEVTELGERRCIAARQVLRCEPKKPGGKPESTR